MKVNIGFVYKNKNNQPFHDILNAFVVIKANILLWILVTHFCFLLKASKQIRYRFALKLSKQNLA
jgi:hypothetical protein